MPITWNMEGANLVSHRSGNRDRTWTPIANNNSIYHFVYETETTTQDGVTTVLIPPRVNFLVDRGPAAEGSQARTLTGGPPPAYGTTR